MKATSRKIILAPYDPGWTGSFAAESERIRQFLGPDCAGIHHIGSTAIPGILAKPIIDILVEVSEIRVMYGHEAAMRTLGYESLGEFGIPGRRYYRKNDPTGRRTHHVHAFEAGSPQARRHLAFRDFMIEHPEWAARYSDLKRKLVDAHAGDADRYIDGKEPFIQEIDRMARAENDRR